MTAADRLVTGQRECDHISATLRDLHWLRVPKGVLYKVSSLTRRCLRGSGPEYLTNCLTTVSSFGGRSHLRSAKRGDFVIPRTRTVRAGGSSFRTSGPVVWNSLPSHLRDSDLSDFKFASELKTYLFDSVT